MLNMTGKNVLKISKQIIYQYDKLGNLVYTKDSTGAINTYTSYDLIGNILSKTDGNGNTTGFAYDALNRNIAVTNALNQTTSYTYDGNGNLSSKFSFVLTML